MDMFNQELTKAYSAFAGDQPLMVIVTGVVVALLLLIHIVSTRRGFRQLTAKMALMEKQAQLINSSAVGIGQRLIALEKKMRSLEHQQDDIRLNDLEFSYSQAQKLIEQNVDVKTIAANSGLSVSEIDLMKMLHTQSQLHHHVA